MLCLFCRLIGSRHHRRASFTRGHFCALTHHTSSPSFNASSSVNFTPTAGHFGLAKEFVITLAANGQFSGDLLE